MAAQQASLTRARPLRLGTAAIAAAPVDGTTAPQREMSAINANGFPTTGLGLGLKAPTVGAAVPIAAGFSVVIWLYNPLTAMWFASSAAAIGFDQAWVTFDFNASALYFQILVASVSVAGDVDFHPWEQ